MSIKVYEVNQYSIPFNVTEILSNLQIVIYTCLQDRSMGNTFIICSN